EHNAVHEVGTRHQGCVQDDRHARDDFVAGEGGEHENVKCNDTGHVLQASCQASMDLRVCSCLISPPCVRHDCAKTSSFQSIASSPLSRAGLRKFSRLRAYISLAL